VWKWLNRHGLLTLTTVAVGLGLLVHYTPTVSGVLSFWDRSVPLWLSAYGQSIAQLVAASWWGVAVGAVMLFALSYVPQSRITALFGHDDRVGTLWRAIAAGLLLDLCSHGILMIAAGLYRKGVSLAKIVAFLVTSPWNSVSTTLIMAGLMGWGWTALFIALSMVVGWLSGALILLAQRQGWIRPDRVAVTNETDDCLAPRPTGCCDEPSIESLPGHEGHTHALGTTVPQGWQHHLNSSLADSVGLLRWLLLGIVITALMRTFVPDVIFHQWFGPSVLGLVGTLLLATVMEVCSEGSAPIAAELLNRGGAPGNGFLFLMAGASTDITELLILRQLTGSWRTALFLPLVTVPQVLVLAWLLNQVR
jgi:uncharacterized protein